MFTAAALAKAHSPAARRKALETMKRNKAIKAKAKGTTTMIDVAGLPTKPKKKARSGTRRIFTPAQRAQIVARVHALAERTGMTLRDACKQVGVHDTQYRVWKRKRGMANGKALNGAGEFDAVRIAVRVGGQDHAVSIDEAMTIFNGLHMLLAGRS